jgi:hypothetical protein
MTKTYSSRSNATRAIVTALKGNDQFAHVNFVAEKVEGGYTNTATVATAAERDALVAVVGDRATVNVDSPSVALEEMGEYGSGTEEAPVCPHCGINHHDNGYSLHGPDSTHEAYEWCCLGCGGEWGPEIPTFGRVFEGFKAAGNSKCASLRLTAYNWDGRDRKGFIAAAVNHGIKATTASANWACMKRGEM